MIRGREDKVTEPNEADTTACCWYKENQTQHKKTDAKAQNETHGYITNDNSETGIVSSLFEDSLSRQKRWRTATKEHGETFFANPKSNTG